MMRIAIGIVLILLIPLVAMQFTDEINWSLVDFITVGFLLGVTGLAYELVTKRVHSNQSRIIIGLGLALVLLLIFIELAVGLIGTPFAGS